MRVAIIGSGGIGGYFGGRLAQGGHEVTFLARGKHLQAIQTQGLSVKSILGDFVINPARSTDKIEALDRPDLVLVCTKAWQVKEVAPQLSSIIHKDTIVIPLQNGIEAIDELSEHIDQSNLIGGLCRIVSKIEAPGIINHFAIEPQIIIGEIDHSSSHRIKQLAETIKQSGIDARTTGNIDVELWKKFIFICTGGLLAVSRSNYGEVRATLETRKMMTDLLYEGFELARCNDINLGDDFVEKTLGFIDTFPPDTTSSLARDIWEGNPSEIDYLNGSVLKMAEKLSLVVPVNKFIYHSVLLMEKKARNSD